MAQPSALKRPACPACGSGDVAEIRYGLPAHGDRELWQAVEEKRVVLGGCCIWDADPRWHCNHCGHRWERRDGKPGPALDLQRAEEMAFRRYKEDPQARKAMRGMCLAEMIAWVLANSPKGRENHGDLG